MSDRAYRFGEDWGDFLTALRVAKFNPSQPRDGDGKWTDTGGGRSDAFMAHVDYGQRDAYGAATDAARRNVAEESGLAVSRYTGGGYLRLNESLMDGVELDEGQQREVELLDGAVVDLPAPLTVARGVSMRVRGAMPEGGALGAVSDMAAERWPVGSTVDMGGNYQSSSMYYEPTLDRTGLRQSGYGQTTAGVVFRIRNVRRGAPAGPWSQFDDEAEVILPRHQRIRITGISTETIETYIGTHERVIIDAEAT